MDERGLPLPSSTYERLARLNFACSLLWLRRLRRAVRSRPVARDVQRDRPARVREFVLGNPPLPGALEHRRAAAHVCTIAHSLADRGLVLRELVPPRASPLSVGTLLSPAARASLARCAKASCRAPSQLRFEKGWRAIAGHSRRTSYGVRDPRSPEQVVAAMSAGSATSSAPTPAPASTDRALEAAYARLRATERREPYPDYATRRDALSALAAAIRRRSYRDDRGRQRGFRRSLAVDHEDRRRRHHACASSTINGALAALDGTRRAAGWRSTSGPRGPRSKSNPSGLSG